MFPSSIFNHVIDSGPGERKGFGNLENTLSQRKIVPYLCNKCGSEYCTRQHGTACISILGDHVLNVDHWVSEEQVLGIDAKTLVTPVANEQSVGDIAVMDDPGESMGVDPFAISKVLHAIVRTRPDSSEPQPTGVGLSDFFPKSLNQNVHPEKIMGIGRSGQ